MSAGLKTLLSWEQMKVNERGRPKSLTDEEVKWVVQVNNCAFR